MNPQDRRAFRAALRGLRWLLSKDARDKDFDVARITSAETNATRNCPLVQAAGLSGEYMAWDKALTRTGASNVAKWAVDHGLEVPDDNSYKYSHLDIAWGALLGAYREVTEPAINLAPIVMSTDSLVSIQDVVATGFYAGHRPESGEQ